MGFGIFSRRGSVSQSKSKHPAKKSSPLEAAYRPVVEALEGRTLFNTALNCPNTSSPTVDANDSSASTDTDAPCDCGTTDQPVNDFSGMPVISETDIQSSGLGGSFNYTRTWSGFNNTGANGNGWTQSTSPYLYVYSTFDPQTHLNDKPVLGYVDANQVTHVYDLSSGTATSSTARFYGQETLAYNTATTQWTVTDSNGNSFVFNDLPRDASGNLTADVTVGYTNQGTYGKIFQSTDPGGIITNYAYYTSRTEAGQVKTIDREDATTGEAEEMQFTYGNWSNSLGGSAELLASVSLVRRANSSSSFQDVRAATYDYYTGDGADAANGRLGDLKLVTIHDGSATGDVIDHDYYRYNKLWGYTRQADTGPTDNVLTMGGTDSTYTHYTSSWSDPYIHYHQGADDTVWSGLKTVVDGAAYDRLAANVSSIGTASDAQVQPYVNHFFTYSRWGDFRWDYENYANDDFAAGYHYYTRYHVTEEIAQGTGCSVCSNGQGVYGYDYYINPSATGSGNDTYDPNVWRMRTIEYLPDSTNADTNGDGQVDSSQWADNDRNIIYTNEDGQVILKVNVDVDDTVHVVSSLSRSGRVVTVTSPTHGLVTGDFIAMDGAVASSSGLPSGVPAGSELAMYNGMYQVTVVDANTFTYTIASTPDNTATPDATKLAWSKVLKQDSTYYRYSQQSASGSAYVGYGQLVLQADPSAVTGYDESYADLVTSGLDPSYNNQYLSDNSGRITLYTYYSSTSATETTAGGAAGYLWQTKIKQGEKDGGSTVTGGGITVARNQYFSHTANGITIYPIANQVTYANTDGTGAETKSYAYTYLSGSLRPQSITTTLPTATSSQNGPNSGDTTTVFYDLYGNPTWTKDGDGYITYTQYDPGTDQLVKVIQDVDTAQTGEFSNLPAGWSTPSGGGLNLVTTITVDGLGRQTQTIDPNGNVNDYVYNDPAHEVREYIGWNATTGTTTEPIHVYREYRPAVGATSDQRTVYDETLNSSATPSVSGTAGSYVPTGTETIDASNLQTLARRLTNTAGQVIESDRYFSFAGITYSQTSPTLGTVSNDSSTGNYSATAMQYDDRGRLRRVVDPTGTITRLLYDERGMITQIWIGTDDTPASGYWSPANTAGTNLVLVESRQYDNDQSNGDENLTQDIVYLGGSATPRVTTMYYDWRDRLVATKDATEASESTSDNTHFITYTDYDNLGRPIDHSTYDGDGVSVIDANGDGVPDKPAASLLRAYRTTAYDGQDRVFKSTRYSVDPGSGTVSSTGLATAYWYDHRGNLIKTQTPGAAFTKTVYDGADRPVIQYVTDAGGDSTWSDAKSVTGDTVLEQTETSYDGDGNAILVNDRLRFNTATGTGVLRVNTSTTTPSRSQYTAYYYDAANRLTNTVNIGSNGGAVYTRPSTVPTRSDAALVTTYSYGAAGRLSAVTDPRGLVAKTTYDALGRTTKTIADYVDGVPSDADDQTTDYTYDGSDNVLTTTARLPAGAFQTTKFIYGASQARGDTLDSNDVLIATQYPDPTTGAATPTQQETYTTDAAGDRTTYEDRNGNVHTYAYDVLGRLTSDSVSPSAVPLSDGNFENPGLGSGSSAYQYDPGSLPWTFTGSAGISANGTDLTSGNSSTPDGSQVGVLTDFGAMSQTVNAMKAGTYSVSFLAAQRVNDGSNQDFEVLVDGNVVGTFTPASGTYAAYDTATINLEAGSHTITFQGLNTAGGDNTAFIDAVTVVPHGLLSHVDNAIRRLETTYNTQGLPSTFTSYDAPTAGSVVNQVLRTYYGFGQVAAEYQAVDGAVNTSTTPEVQYGYDTPANGSRLTAMTYPNGRVLTYNYAAGVDSTISRLTSITDGSTTIESYKYLGLGMVVERDHPQDGVNLTYIGTGTGDGGDQYTGLDRFDRVTNQKWVNGNGTVVDGYTYTYDRDSNPLSKGNSTDTALNETYSYDGLNRLTDSTRNGVAYQSWGLDALGNMGSVTTQGTTQSRTNNSQNQLTAVGTASLNYDDNGNTRVDEQGRTLVYDAWNRLVEAKNGTTSLIRYAFDALGRQVKAGSTNVYFDVAWQEIEDRNASGQTVASYAWSPVYVDAMIARDRDTDGNSTLDERLYATQDANWNVTSIVSATGPVQERFSYDAYGKQQVYTAGWAGTTDARAWRQGFQGGFYDATLTNLMLFCNRILDTDTMRWLQQDSLGYINGNNLFLYVGANPSRFVDPSGHCGEEEEEELEQLAMEALRDVSPSAADAVESELQSLNNEISDEEAGLEKKAENLLEDAKDAILGGDSQPDIGNNESILKPSDIDPGDSSSATDATATQTETGPPASTPVGQSGSPLGTVQGNTATTIGDNTFSGHALDEMQRDGIPPSVVSNAIQNGTQIAGKEAGTTAFHDTVNNITVIVNSTTQNIITVSRGIIKQ